jgi:death-on-curing protein
MNVEYVRADVLLNVHGRLLERYGGVAGVRDANGLEAAIARPQNLALYGQIGSIGILGAALAWSLLRNHPFADGNKRSAFAALTIFLDLNGYRWICSEVEETSIFLLAAGSEISEEEFTAWVERSIALK